MVRQSISKIKNGKAGRLSVVVSKTVKAGREARADMVTDLVNQIQ